MASAIDSIDQIGYISHQRQFAPIADVNLLKRDSELRSDLPRLVSPDGAFLCLVIQDRRFNCTNSGRYTSAAKASRPLPHVFLCIQFGAIEEADMAELNEALY